MLEYVTMSNGNQRAVTVKRIAVNLHPPFYELKAA